MVQLPSAAQLRGTAVALPDSGAVVLGLEKRSSPSALSSEFNKRLPPQDHAALSFMVFDAVSTSRILSSRRRDTTTSP